MMDPALFYVKVKTGKRKSCPIHFSLPFFPVSALSGKQPSLQVVYNN